MLLAHLSDPHLTTGPLMAGPAGGLHAALGRLLGLPTRPDAVVITGDLVDRGDPGAYQQLRELLVDVPVPVYLATGNHDDRDAFLATFAGTTHLAGGDAAHDTVDLPGATLVVLDSLVPGRSAGRLSTDQLAWLDAVLSQRSRMPALHHPPGPVGIPFLDRMPLFAVARKGGASTAQVAKDFGVWGVLPAALAADSLPPRTRSRAGARTENRPRQNLCENHAEADFR